MNEPVAINFSRDVGWSGNEVMELSRDAVSSLDLSFNYDSRPEIGAWQAMLPRERFDAAWAALRASGYETLPGPTTIAPGTKLLSVGVRGPKEALPRMRGFPMKPPPPELVTAVQALEAAMAELRKHPLRVLRGQATLSASHIKRGEALAIHLKLTNAGTHSLTTANPLANDSSAWSGIRLVLKDARGNERQIDVTPADLRSPVTSRDVLALLTPGASLDIDVKTKVDVPTGVHSVRVEVHSLVGDSPDPRFVGGTLWLETGNVTIDRGAWWKTSQ
jgi:hypothetical protein